ncbi:MAG: helix-turn-helix transcriptional regulator [Lawsonibacter sp.]|nr:helix-turn-helix transcriptional regulator [Lawsonibacter sp.]
MVDYKLIGSRIKQRRENSKMTQERVAELVNITVVYLSKIENGKVRPTLDTLAAICSALNCDLGEILLNITPESNQYQNERVIKLFQSCSPNVKPIALKLLEQLTEL